MTGGDAYRYYLWIDSTRSDGTVTSFYNTYTLEAETEFEITNMAAPFGEQFTYRYGHGTVTATRTGQRSKRSQHHLRLQQRRLPLHPPRRLLHPHRLDQRLVILNESGNGV